MTLNREENKWKVEIKNRSKAGIDPWSSNSKRRNDTNWANAPRNGPYFTWRYLYLYTCYFPLKVLLRKKKRWFSTSFLYFCLFLTPFKNWYMDIYIFAPIWNMTSPRACPRSNAAPLFILLAPSKILVAYFSIASTFCMWDHATVHLSFLRLIC